MSDRASLVRLAKLVAKDVAAGSPGENSLTAAQFLSDRPEAALELIGLTVAESAKARPNGNLLSAYVYLFGHALETLRYGIDDGHAQAAALFAAIREVLERFGASEAADAAVMMLLLGQFAAAKLDPGEPLRQIMAELMEGMGPGEPDESDPGAFIKELAQALEGDVFALCEQMRDMTVPLPEEHRADVGMMLLRADIPAAREAAVGWLLDPSPLVRDMLASALGQAGGQVSGITLRRMITLRNWLPENGRAGLDQAIQTCRRKGVQCASWPKGEIVEIHATSIDGAGSQSVFVVGREGRRSTLGCLLLKQGFGVRDAWARHGLTKAEVKEFLAAARAGMDLLPVARDFIETAVPHFLAVNRRAGEMPPFGLLAFLEMAGLASAPPAPASAESLLDRLPAHDPALALEAPVDPIAESWFEDDDAVHLLLGAKRLTRPRRVALVLDQLLPARREKWVEHLAWMAFTLSGAKDNRDWPYYATAARALADPLTPLADIPLMRLVAEQTVEAYLATRGRR